MANLIASGTTDLDSAEFTLTALDACTLSLTSALDPAIPNGAQAVIKLKTSNSTWLNIGTLDGITPAQVLSAPGTYKVTRRANATAFAVDKV